MAFRFSGEQSGSDGYIDNPTRGEDDFARRELQTIRTKLRWRPIDQIDVIASYSFTDNLLGLPNVEFDTTGNARTNFSNDPRIDVSTSHIVIENGLVVEGSENFTDFSHSFPENRPNEKSDSRFIFNGRVGYETEA